MAQLNLSLYTAIKNAQVEFYRKNCLPLVVIKAIWSRPAWLACFKVWSGNYFLSNFKIMVRLSVQA